MLTVTANTAHLVVTIITINWDIYIWVSEYDHLVPNICAKGSFDRCEHLGCRGYGVGQGKCSSLYAGAVLSRFGWICGDFGIILR